MPTRGLVLGGGGVTGIAWEIGVLAGLAESGVDVLNWDAVVGTSAGSLVGARLLTVRDVEALYEREADPDTTAEDTLVRVLGGRAGALSFRVGRRPQLRWAPGLWLTASTLEAWVRSRARPPRARAVDETFPAGVTPIAGPDAASMRFGVLSLSARTAREAQFVEVIRDAIRPAEDWPEVLRVTTVDAHRGLAVAIDGRAGIPLHRAIAASSSVPVLFPSVRFLGRAWIDGGMASTTHVPVAAGCEEVLVIAPLPARTQDEEVAQVRASGARVDVIMPGPEAAQVVGRGLALLDPRRRPLAARAGLEDGRRAAAMLLAGRTVDAVARDVDSVAGEADSAA